MAADDAREARAAEYGIPYVAVIPDEWLDPELVRDVPVDWARAHRLLPVQRPEGTGVMIEDPTRIEALDDLLLLLRCEASPVVAPPEEIARAIERCYVQQDDSTRRFLETLEPAAEGTAVPGSTNPDLLRVADAAPVTQLVNLILLEAVKGGASDIHIEPSQHTLRVRYRIDGLLYDQAAPPKHLEAALVSRLKVMGHLDIAERRLPQDGMARVRVGEREIDIRVSTIPVSEGERVVLRLLNRDSALIPLAELGMPEDVRGGFEASLQEPNGVILVTGPTGSGKTTTLYAALNLLDTAHRNILTIEDPVEYQLAGIGQMQVKPKIGLTFANGLRHMLRQDPDIVLVGEVRDLETAEIMIRASLTGHLVFSTLHTNDAANAVLRLVDMGIPAYLIGAALRAVLAQRLVRQLCPHCSTTGPVEEAILADWGRHAATLRGQTLRHPGVGCEHCLGGFSGRVGLFELMRVDAALQEAIRTGSDSAALEARARAAGMRSLLDDAVVKIAEGKTGLDEVKQVFGARE